MNKGNTHMNATLNAIPRVVFNRLVKLTSITKNNAQMRMDGKYQGHAKALTNAVLDLKIFPTLK